MPDLRRIPIKKVGVKGVRYPVTVLDKANGVQHATATVDLFADLPHAFKGTHMSRFIEVFNEHRADLSMPNFMRMVEEIREALHAETAYATVRFPYFVEKTAPASAQKSVMAYDCAFSGRASGDGKEFRVSVSVPVQTVCPCSKAISERGAHNQRGLVTVEVEVGPFFWIEDLIAALEASASCDVFTLLKRDDEKLLTEKAYDNPRFVEDVVREATTRVRDMGLFRSFTVEAENQESIHAHSAYAFAEYPPAPESLELLESDEDGEA